MAVGLNTQWCLVQTIGMSTVYYKNKWIMSNAIAGHTENSLSHLWIPRILYFKIVRAASAVAAEYHDTMLGGVTDGSTKFNITPKKLRWASAWCNGNCILWVSTVFSMRGVWAERDACHEYNSLIVQRCSGWICLTATGHTPPSSFHYGHWLRDLATA